MIVVLREVDVMTTTERFSIPVLADLVAGPEQGHWTYADYAALPDDGRHYEVMDGVLLMSPSPSPAHQSVVNWIAFYLTQYVLLTDLGRVFSAPLDVELAPNKVVQPDVLVLLNKNLNKVTASRIVGAPDLVVEVRSPGTAAYDRLNKLGVYAQEGVQEYWMVNPDMQTIEILVLQNGIYVSRGVLRGKNGVSSQVVPGIASIKVEQFFM
jgi:Uma2 family endonuclease